MEALSWTLASHTFRLRAPAFGLAFEPRLLYRALPCGAPFER